MKKLSRRKFMSMVPAVVVAPAALSLPQETIKPLPVPAANKEFLEYGQHIGRALRTPDLDGMVVRDIAGDGGYLLTQHHHEAIVKVLLKASGDIKIEAPVIEVEGDITLDKGARLIKSGSGKT